MSDTSPRVRRYVATGIIYLALVASVLGFNVIRARTAPPAEPNAAPEAPTVSSTKPYFSLTTNRTYSPNEPARMWASYQNVDHLDFRIYRVKDPNKFFKQLDNPHQMGDEEKEELAKGYGARISLLERTRRLKLSFFSAMKDYVRNHLRKEHRTTFNNKFRKEEEQTRTPLNVADYARVPLLNPDQKVKDWREKLPALENEYDSRTIPIGKMDPGVYLIEAVNNDLRAYSIAIVTNLTMVQKTTSDGQVVVFVVDRKTGAPRPGANVEITNAKKTLATGTTDKSGVFKTEIKPPETTEETPAEDVDPEESQSNAYLIMARDRDNFVISDVDSFYFSGEGGDMDLLSSEDLTSYIYTDRPIYRPAQKVYFKGILRQWGREGYKLLDEKTVSVTIEDPNSGKIFEKELPLSTRGTFSGEVDIADEAPLGGYNITAKIGEATSSGYFEVQEYKKPEYKVTVKGPKEFAAIGEKVRFTVNANYFFGAPVTNADVQYYVYKQRYYHWWWDADESDEFDDEAGPDNEGGDEEDYGYYGTDLVTQGEGTLNSRGEMVVDFEVPAPGEKEDWDYSYRLEAQVTDASRREMSGAASFIGTRGKAVADAFPERYLYYQGDAAKIRVKTATYSGQPVSEKVTLQFIEQKWEKIEKQEEYNGYKYTTYDYKLHERQLGSADVNTDSQGNATYDFTVPSPGSVYVKAIIYENGKPIVNRGGAFWAPDKQGQWSDFQYRDYEENAIKLVPDKKSYRPGETAHVLAMLPKDNAHLLVTTELSEVLTVRQIDSPGRSIVIDVPIEKRYAPNVYLNVAFVQDSDMFEQSQILAVPARDRMLKLDIVPNKKEFKPRDVASYTIMARNEDGSPAANAEVSLGIVDEAIYSIASESAGNIKRDFYGRRYNEVQTSLAVHYTFTGYAGDNPADLAKNKSAYQLADFKNESSSLAEPTVRKEFKDTAFWQPDVVTGGDGKATVEFKLPDNLTTWRATARAVTADTRVGSAVQKTIARKDVIMRLEMPRFLTEGDTVTISGVVHNFLKTDKSTKISLDLTGAQLLDAPSQAVTIRQNGEHRVDWRVQAHTVGKLTLLAKALTDKESDAVEMSMEIVPHGLKQTLGNTTTLMQNEADQTFNLDLPGRADDQARTLRIEASPSIAGALFGALDYLTSYPYGCTEQTMSSFLPNVVVAQALKDIPSAKIRATNDLDKKVQRGLDRLYAYQHGDGGWGWWKDDKSDPFMTAYVVDGLTMASRAGYQVDGWRQAQGRQKLEALLTAGKNDNGNPIDEETRAYMIYAHTESGEGDARFLEELYGKRGSLGPYGRALLALALQERKDGRAREIASLLESSARQDEFEAHWQTARINDYGRDVYLDAEATALSLKALAQINPGSPLLPKVARWLVKNRRNGHYWLSTKETAFAIYGLTDYLKVSKELSPDYSFEVYLNGVKIAGQHVGAGEASNAQSIVITKKAGEVGGSNQIRVVKKGRGALYVSSSLEYFTADENVAPQSANGLKITREYLRLHVSGEEGQASWRVEPLSGELRSGDMIVVRLRLTGPRAQYLMIEDPIPAGAEQVARVSGINLNYSTGQWSDWYSNREFRDNRTVIFMNYFDGDATLQYAMRVEVPGEFKIAPARAELMYQPTVQANTANDRLRILDKK